MKCREKFSSSSVEPLSLLQKFMVVVVLLFHDHHHQRCYAITITNNQTYCPSSSCGTIRNIKHPFRLQNDPANCGDPRYELSCENNITTLTLFSGKYYVKSINYRNYSMRVVDLGIQEGDCSSMPRYFLTAANFTSSYDYNYHGDPYELGNGQSLVEHVIYLNCSNQVKNDPLYVDTSPCRINSANNSYVYAIDRDFSVGELNVGCRVKIVTISSAPALIVTEGRQPFPYKEIHRLLSYGFELSWMRRGCEDHCDNNNQNCFMDYNAGYLVCQNDDCITPLGLQINCVHLSKMRILIEDVILGIVKGLLQIVGVTKSSELAGGEFDLSNKVSDSKIAIKLGRISGRYILPSLVMRFTTGLVVFFVLLIYTCRRKHASIYENIEVFLRGSTMMPIRYSYKDIKKMTRSFKVKLGEGGFGCVYKGNLISGPFVAIKMLGNSKGNGQDFINEVATIGRIHHANVVRLIGFCFERSKRALVYEFMPNGSLDKYISSKDDVIDLTCKKMYEISLGVARGIAYLHEGCDMQILHFDIKPHNILLDENFIPKVSDFGLAKLYPNDISIVTLTAARGTIGYMAPELFYKNIGGVSYKADVYSFGMLLMEMASKKRNLNPHADRSSQIFFPIWIYNQLIEDKEIEIDEITYEENNNVKKMFIIALWCIQLKPCDRPSMNKVIEMLEGNIENIEMPPKPSLYPNEMIQEDLDVNSNEIESENDGSTSLIDDEDATKSLLMNSA